MSNTIYSAVLFHNQRTNDRQPVLSGYVTVPVARLDQMIELLKAARIFQESQKDGSKIDTVRIPLSFWTGRGKAPLAFKGESSFYTPDEIVPNTTRRMAVTAPADLTPEVDPTPELTAADF